MNAGAFCLPGSFRCVDALAIDLLFAFDSVLWLLGVLLLFKLGALATGYCFETRRFGYRYLFQKSKFNY
jgi:hypothetical protein